MRRSLIVSIVVGTFAFAACGGGGSKAATDTSTTVAGDTTTTTTAAATVGPVTVDESVWFAGFKLDLGEATFTAQPSPVVEIATGFDNLGTDSARLDARLILTQGGASITSTASDIPLVPGGTTGKGSLIFNVAPNFMFEDAVLTIGNTENNQAVVPLGPTGTLVTLEPVAVSAKGKATAGQLVISVHDGEVRADIPATHDEVEKDQLALSLDFDITNNGTGGGGYAFVADNLALTLPDGTTVAPDKAPIELLGHQATTKNLTVRFLVDNPAEGDYVLLLREGSNTGKVKFTIS